MPSDLYALTSDMHCSSAQRVVGAQGVVASLAHLTVRWHTGQSGELWRSASPKSREWLVHLLYGLVHQTLSGALKTSTLKSFAPFLIVSLTEFLSWFLLNLMHLR